MTKYARKPSTRKAIVPSRRAGRPKAKKAMQYGKPKPFPPPGFKERPGGLLVPEAVGPIPPTILADEIKRVHSRIGKMLDAIISLPIKDGYEIGEINVTLSFSAKGEFLGIGVGGAATVGMKIKPQAIE